MRRTIEEPAPHARGWQASVTPDHDISVAETHRRTNRLLGVTIVLFFVSGASALMYQTLWLRLLALVFGVTVYAASTVLASFMTGLALGSLLVSRIASRVRRPLLWFGVAELLVAVAALATPKVLDLTQVIYVAIRPVIGESPGLLTLTRFIIAFTVLIVPTMLMGATLPLVTKSSLTAPELLGSRISLLYAMNTAGAIAGALLAGFYLIPYIGMRDSFFVAASLNILIGLTAIALGRGLMPRAADPLTADASPASEPSADRSTASAASDRQRWIVLAVFACSGFASFALEVLWFRVMVIFLRPTTYAFTIMLANVLGGIAIGSALVTPFLTRRRNWLAVLVWLELALALVVLSSFTALRWSFDATSRTAPLVDDSRTLSYLLPLLMAGLFAILPTSLLLGAAFPVGVRLWLAGDEAGREAATRVGQFYAVNVCGALLGSLAAGFFLIPLFGSQASLILLAGISLVSALALMLPLIARLTGPPRTLALATALAGLVVFVAGARYVPNPFDMALAERHPGERLLWREEGVQTTVAVHESGGRRIMYLDGHHQANDSGGMAFVHHRIGFLPAALHPDPKRALVVGLGGGATPGAVARFPGINVDVVELSQTVVNGAAWFERINFGVLGRPNVRLRVDDGRNFLLLSEPGQYDIITADAILPHHAGAGNLYSFEYFRLVRRALRPDGLVLQWIGSNTETEYLLQLRTFLRVFPHATLWGDGSLLIGSQRPFRLSRAAYDRKLADPVTREALEHFTIASYERLAGLYVAGSAALSALAGEGPILTDDRPRVEYFLSLPRDERPIDLSHLQGDVREIERP